MLESEELRDPPRELTLDRRQHSVGIHDAPDRLDQQQALLAGKALGHEPRELVEIDARLSRLLGEAEDFPHVPFRDAEVLARMPRDPLPLLRVNVESACAISRSSAHAAIATGSGPGAPFSAAGFEKNERRASRTTE